MHMSRALTTYIHTDTQIQIHTKYTPLDRKVVHLFFQKEPDFVGRSHKMLRPCHPAFIPPPF